MEFKQIEVVLKDGTPCYLRSPGPNDGASVLRILKKVSGETNYLSRDPDEIKISLFQEKQFLHTLMQSQKDLMICAYVRGRLVANAGIHPVAEHERYIHRANFGISILKSHWGLGIGSYLLSAIIEGARSMNYEQLELEVIQSNERGITLYKKWGFEIYGARRHGFKYRDGSYGDEYLMMLPLK